MLTELYINNFTLIKQSTIPWKSGLTVITGETGAGKSIALEALSFCLGGKITGDIIYPNTELTTIQATFSVCATSPVHKWFNEQSIELNNNECIIRRTIKQHGRSKSFVCGVSVSLGALKELSKLLLIIHGQQSQRELIKPLYQQKIIDQYIQQENNEHTTQITTHDKVKQTYNKLKALLSSKEAQQQIQEKNKIRLELLTYQKNELDSLDLSSGEFEALMSESILLSNATELLSVYHSGLSQLNNEYEQEQNKSILSLLSSVYQSTQHLSTMDSVLTEISSELFNVIEQINDITNKLRKRSETVIVDEARLTLVDERLNTSITLAKKYGVSPTELTTYHNNIIKEIDTLTQSDIVLHSINNDIIQLEKDYANWAGKLSTQRKQSAQKLSEEITRSIQTLNMEHGRFFVEVKSDKSMVTAHGQDIITFKLSVNACQPLQNISAVASGGEMSRISLAIQVAISSKQQDVTLVFDEVDVGISGQTAVIVGGLLKQLGKNTQVISVTHLAQVAAQGDQHLKVEKKSNNKQAVTNIFTLNHQGRIDELSRLVGGHNITELTRKHACALLSG